ncbi:TNF receptor-associated factor 3-like [Halichondria panicea]|uniref:TNF receptor-associated factor 3-like n=1 Tax=Halichondria panicea TaxID=6063 RepID=UPI00312BBA54
MASNSIGGYDLNWLEDPPDDLKCLICLCVARDPHQHPGDTTNECGKIFCHSCITEMNKKNETTCPNCRKNLTDFKDAKSTRQIRSLKVKCDNQKNGCGWTGELGDLYAHLEGPNHRSRCDFEPVPCKYARVGCEEKPLRKDLSKHEEDVQLHFQVTTEKVLELTKTNSHLLKLTSTVPCTIKLPNYRKLNSDKNLFYSPPFYTSYTGYKMCLIVNANGWGPGEGTHVSVFAHLMKGDNDDSLSWPFTGTVTVQLLNQLEDNNHHHIMMFTFPAESKSSQRVVDVERAPCGGGYHTFISHADLDYNADQNIQYLKDDTLVFKVSLTDHKPWLN